MAIRYELPLNWIRYDFLSVANGLLEAKATLMALSSIPYQRSWADELQRIQLKREVAGTSRIEGAEFTERELDAAMSQAPGQLETRSQRQAAAAVATYRWIAALPQDVLVDGALIREVHRRIVLDCDDDHCAPGQLRGQDQNVTFGAPRHRGAEGGAQCEAAFSGLVQAAQTVFKGHDPLIQALALHYHLAAMHPFLDGNGRTARAVEALLLQRTGLRDTLFIAMSNYYYEEKTSYLEALNQVRAAGHDLTPFLAFALKGVESQCKRLFAEITLNVKKALFRNTMTDLFGRLMSPRKRVMTERQVKILNLLLDEGELERTELEQQVRALYAVQNWKKAMNRDLDYLSDLGAVRIRAAGAEGDRARFFDFFVAINLDWPTQITETEFFARAKQLPKGKVHGFLSE